MKKIKAEGKPREGQLNADSVYCKWMFLRKRVLMPLPFMFIIPQLLDDEAVAGRADAGGEGGGQDGVAGELV